jgi:hypothetical protein
MGASARLRERYFANRFVDQVRNELVIDEAEWLGLEQCLKDLATEWRGQDAIDKDIAQDLYPLPGILNGVADRIAPDERSEIVRERATLLDALILEVLRD